LKPVISVTVDRSTSVTTGHLRMTVAARARELASIADPQAWCSTPHFFETYKVRRVRGAYRRDPEPPVNGEGWKGLLYEDFRWTAGPLRMVWFRNLLNVDFRATSRRIDLDYSLHRPLSGGTWYSPVPVGVDVDSGFLRAAEDGAGTTVEICKRVRFVELARPDGAAPAGAPGEGLVSDFVNFSAPVALELWLRAIAASLS
jgi:hypothetical protein